MNLKLHLIVSTVFLLLIFGALSYFSTTQAPPSTPAPVTSDRFIQIARATWGENCNSYIQSVQQQVEMGKVKGPAPTLIRRDNALRSVSTLCNGKEQCQFAARPQALGFDPVANCQKQMVVEYRCFVSDRSHEAITEDGATVLIDCTQPQG